jgi:hypothetical protein
VSRPKESAGFEPLNLMDDFAARTHIVRKLGAAKKVVATSTESMSYFPRCSAPFQVSLCRSRWRLIYQKEGKMIVFGKSDPSGHYKANCCSCENGHERCGFEGPVRRIQIDRID